MSHEYDTWPAGTRVPIPQAENQFNQDIMGPTSEVVEAPTQFEYARGYGQMDYEQPIFQVLPIEEIMSHEYDTWPAGTRAENQFNEDIIGPEVVEPPTQFEYARGYGQMDYEQSMFQDLMAEEIITHDYGTWPAGTSVPILQRDNPFCADSVKQMLPGHLQYPPQLEWKRQAAS